MGVVTGNTTVVALCDQIAAFMDQPRWRRLRDDSISKPGRMPIHFAEDVMIYEAVREGDADAAEFLRRVRRYMAYADQAPQGEG